MADTYYNETENIKRKFDHLKFLLILKKLLDLSGPSVAPKVLKQQHINSWIVLFPSTKITSA